MNHFHAAWRPRLRGGMVIYLMDLGEGFRGPSPGTDFGMKEMRQKLDSIDESGAGAGEVGVRIHGKNTILADGGEVGPPGDLKELSG